MPPANIRRQKTLTSASTKAYATSALVTTESVAKHTEGVYGDQSVMRIPSLVPRTRIARIVPVAHQQELKYPACYTHASAPSNADTAR